jgi:hypothetical protein
MVQRRRLKSTEMGRYTRGAVRQHWDGCHLLLFKTMLTPSKCQQYQQHMPSPEASHPFPPTPTHLGIADPGSAPACGPHVPLHPPPPCPFTSLPSSMPPPPTPPCPPPPSNPPPPAPPTQVVCQLVVCGDDVALPAGVKLGPPRPPKYLLHIQHGQLCKGAALGIIHLGGVGVGGVWVWVWVWGGEVLGGGGRGKSKGGSGRGIRG